MEKDMENVEELISRMKYATSLGRVQEWNANEVFVASLENLIQSYKKLEEKNKNKGKILENIREEFLKYDWENSNSVQTYNQLKSLYENIYLKTDFEGAISQVIPKSLIKEIFQNKRNELFSNTYLSKEQYAPFEKAVEVMNDLEKKLLGDDK